VNPRRGYTLAGLRRAAGLRELNVGRGDLPPRGRDEIAACTSLRSLGLPSTELDATEFLRPLGSFEWLALWQNPLASLAGFGAFPRLARASSCTSRG
jgi:hypothetical protein